MLNSYLSHFASPIDDDKGCIWTYDKKGGAPRLQSAINSAVEKDIYSFPDSVSEPPDYVETEIMTPVENAALPILDRLRGGETDILESDDFVKVIAFMALLHLRVPKSIDGAKEFLEAGFREYLRLIGSDPQKVKELHEKGKDKEGGHSISEAQLADALMSSEKHLKIKAKKEYVLANILPQFFGIGKQLALLNWSICSVPKMSFFVTSDTPLVVFCPFGDNRAKFGTGFALPQVQVHLPLTPKMCLFGSRYTTVLKWQMPKSDVDQANARSICSAQRFVFSAYRSNRIGKIVAKAAASAPSTRINKEALREQLKKQFEDKSGAS